MKTKATYFIIDVNIPPDLETLATESGYTVTELETYLWNARFSGYEKMTLPDKTYNAAKEFA